MKRKLTIKQVNQLRKQVAYYVQDHKWSWEGDEDLGDYSFAITSKDRKGTWVVRVPLSTGIIFVTYEPFGPGESYSFNFDDLNEFKKWAEHIANP